MKKHLLKTILKKYNLQSTTYSTVSKKYYKSVVGLEIHAQISTKTKLFSGAETDFSSPVNTNVALFDAAIPGTLPVLNRKCVEAGVLTALALSCHVNAVSYFDRKHYFYADLPAGYQITQQRAPLANDGFINFEVFTPGIHKKPYTKSSKIIQIQLEQDSGKSLHDDEEKLSLVDLNRAGIPLMELVFEPDLTDGEEAAALVKELMTILSRLETCSCKMEEGALRVDANVSVHEENQPFGQRTEIKNIGSVRGVASAINYEIHRQLELIQKGEIIENETRNWDSETKTTVAMRDKEKKQDYRFMPEPNLPPLQLKMPGVPTIFPGLVDVETLKNRLPELPEETRTRLQETFAVSKEVVIILVNEPILLKHFESICEDRNRNSKLVANILINELLTTLNKNKIQLEECNMSSNILGEIVDLIESKKINLLTTRKVLNEILVNNDKESPIEIVTKNNWTQITYEEEIKKICKDCIERNSNLVKKYKNGKTKIFSALLGDIANITEQRVDMGTVTRILKEMLK